MAAYDEEAGVGTVEDGIQVIDTAPGDAVKEPAASTQLNTVADTPIAQLASNSVSSSSSTSDDDDEEEEEDDITDALDDDDEDDEEETEADAEEEEEEDDEDDLIGEDVIEARARESRSNKSHNTNHRSAKKRKASHVTAIAKGKRISQKPTAAVNAKTKKTSKLSEPQS